MKPLEVLRKVLYEEEGKTLKLYYKVDILIQNFPDKEVEEPETPTPETPPAPEAGLQVTGTPTESTLYEEIYKNQEEGESVISKENIDNIQTLDDLVEYCTDSKVDGKSLINDLTAEVILTVAGVGTSSLEELIHKGDKVFINLDYGEEKANSIGLRINKLSGSDAISISMKKNNNIIPGDFKLEEFNKQVTYFRNSVLGEKE